MTAYQPKHTASSKKQPKPYHNTLISNNNINQYRDGPGILILDHNIWVIAKWKKNELITAKMGSTENNKIYIIDKELNIMELCIDSQTANKE
jgi:hypothetical protein